MWEYSDYVTLDDPSTRLARLRLHIQEVSDRVLSVTGGLGGDVSASPTDYLKELKKEEASLMTKTGNASGNSYARTQARFRHG